MSALPPSIMVLGTSSNAGKSLLVTGLCRVFARRGLSVAPFKAQNMALNSAVTPDGLEIGRAQAVQAQACGLLPDARMNPVLLKPSSDTGSQLVVLGKAMGHYKVREYEKLKPELFQTACQAYAELAAGRDLMILEGAGSPAEINLKASDIVNTRMARAAGAKAVLAGDIDRGGVFAALVGTLALLEPWERDLIAGLVLNKFRGDPSLLPPALEEVSARTGKPFLGVLPWLDIRLPEEDSVGLRAGAVLRRGPARDVRTDELDVAILEVAHAGNISDVDPLPGEPGLKTRLVARPEDLGRPDLVIIPGSKSTALDLRLLRQSGVAVALRDLLETENAPDVLGICGGLQMMGKTLEDPEGIEEQAGYVEPCLGLLPLATVMRPIKTLRRAAYRDALLDLPLRGYEIHHGASHLAQPGVAAVWMRDDAGETIGWRDDKGTHRLWATYAHGLFEDDAYRCALLNDVRRHRGKPERTPSSYSLEPALDALADAVETHLDLDMLFSGKQPGRGL